MLGISTDARATQTAWSVAMGNIPYPTLSDFHPHGAVTSLYGIYSEEKGTALRSVIVIDKQGVIRFKRTYANAADIHTDDILAEIDRLKG